MMRQNGYVTESALEDASDIGTLAMRATGGDESAIAALMDVSARIVYAKVRTALIGDSDADDIAQEILLRAYVGLPRLRDHNAFLGWLRRIADNVIVDHYERRRKHSETEVTQELLDDPRSNPENTVITNDIVQRIRESLKRMKPRSRIVVELFYFHDMTCREVAKFLSISHDATRAVLSRARTEMRSLVMSKVIAAEKKRSSRLTVVSGSRRGGAGPLYDHDSPQDRLYHSLYPTGDLVDAAKDAGLTIQEAEAELEILCNLRLVSARGDTLRCTSPIVSETDLELVLPWAERVAATVTKRLDTLYKQAIDISSSLPSERQRSTVVYIAMNEASRRPFDPIFKEMKSSTPARGEHGSFRTVTFDCDVPAGKLFHGGFGSSISHNTAAYWCRPQHVARPKIDEFLKGLRAGDANPPTTPDEILKRVAWTGSAALSDENLELIPFSLGCAGESVERLRRGLIDTDLLVEDGSLSAVPVLAWSEWSKYLDELDKMGREVADIVCETASDLRRRAAICSFADCNFDDSLQVFFTVVENLVAREIESMSWIDLPTEATFDWGAMVVREKNTAPLIYAVDALVELPLLQNEHVSESECKTMPVWCVAMPGNASQEITDMLAIRIERVVLSSSLGGESVTLHVSGTYLCAREKDAESVQVCLVAEGHAKGEPVILPSIDGEFSLRAKLSGSHFRSENVRKMRVSVEAKTDDGCGGYHGNVVDLMLQLE